MQEWILSSPIVRLFVIIALGYLLGEIKFPGGFRLGVTGGLFVGLGLGALGRSMELPSEIQTLGLVLFVYCIGLQAAPGFFKSFKKEGLRLNLAVLLSLVLAFVATGLIIRMTGRSAPLIAGIFSGALTNTPALGAITEMLTRTGMSAADVNLAVVGYGVAYPIAIVCMLVLIQVLATRNDPKNAAAEISLPLPGPVTIQIENLGENSEAWRAGTLGKRTGVLITRYRLPDGSTGLATQGAPFLLEH
jgi:AspT/YidE/YbjL antiporter-like protein